MLKMHTITTHTDLQESIEGNIEALEKYLNHYLGGNHSMGMNRRTLLKNQTWNLVNCNLVKACLVCLQLTKLPTKVIGIVFRELFE